MRSISILIVAIALLLGWTTGNRSTEKVSWQEVHSIFDAKCTSCHSGEAAARGLRLDTWQNVFLGSKFGETVIPYNSENSLLLELATKFKKGSHPAELEHTALTKEEISTIRDWVDAGGPSADDEIPYSDPDAPRLYVANQGAGLVSVIDMNTNQVVRIVDLTGLGYSEFSMPHHIAVERDGSYWYLSVIMADKILKFTRDNKLVGEVDATRPGLLALDPKGPWLYAARSMMSVSPPESMVQIDRESMEAEEIELLMPRPHALAVSADGESVFVSSLAQNRIASLDSGSGEIQFTDVEGDNPHVFIGFTISPDGRTMVGTSEVSSRAFVFDISSPDAIVLADTIGVLRAPWHPTYTTDGHWVYFGNNWTNSITVLNMEKRKVERVIRGDGLAQPHGSAISPDGRYVYISNRNLAMPEGHSKHDHVYHPRYDLGDNAHIGTVLVIDTDTQQIVKIIETEEYASGMGAALPRR